jgi:hypothetical protein
VERRKSKNKWVVVTDYGDFTSSTGTVETDIFLRNSLYPHDEEASDDEAQDTPDHERASHNGPRSDYKRSINGPGSDRKRSLNGPRVQHQPQESQRPGSAKRQKAIKVMSAGLTVHERDRGRSQSRPSTLCNGAGQRTRATWTCSCVVSTAAYNCNQPILTARRVAASGPDVTHAPHWLTAIATGIRYGITFANSYRHTRRSNERTERLTSVTIYFSCAPSLDIQRREHTT